MIHTLWLTVLYQPFYNALIFLTNTVAFGDVGVAVIVLTILVKLALFPLSKKATVSQIKMRSIQGELDDIKKNNPDKKEQSKKTFELYKREGVNPFSSCLVLAIQLPIIIALYSVFYKDIAAGQSLLYSFIHFPKHLSPTFLGILDLHAKNIYLALLAGVTQFFYAHLTIPSPSKIKEDEKLSVSSHLARNMQIQTKYIMPIFIVFVSYRISAVVALYWTTSNIVTILQEIWIRRKLKREMIAKN